MYLSATSENNNSSFVRAVSSGRRLSSTLSFISMAFLIATFLFAVPNGFEGTDPIQVCTELKNNTISDTDRARVRRLLGNDATGFDRENGARFLLSIIGEIAIEQQFSVFLILEGAPFQQAERALFTSLFSGSMADRDYRIYGHAGVTLKF